MISVRGELFQRGMKVTILQAVKVNMTDENGIRIGESARVDSKIHSISY